GAPVPITGLNASETVLKIATRPATGEIYGVTNASRLITINPTSGAASVKATMSIAITGVEVGMDFNATNDMLRIIGDNGQNLNVNPDTGAASADGTLGLTNVTAISYTNSVVGASSTTLYGIATQGGVSAASLIRIDGASGTTTPIGQLVSPGGPVSMSVITGLDIAATDNTAYLAVSPPGVL